MQDPLTEKCKITFFVQKTRTYLFILSVAPKVMASGPFFPDPVLVSMAPSVLYDGIQTWLPENERSRLRALWHLS